MDPRFDFSVIIPIYNVEQYLEEAILSIVNQDIGFKEHIQLILINDGSPDNSEDICLRYRDLYPDNVVYVWQENAGVSAARNHGMEYIQGKYVNFLDSDDMWGQNVFSQVFRFFEQKQKEIDVVACKLEFFGARVGSHPLNYKFTDERPERVIDLMNDYQDIECHCASCFFKADAIGSLRFKTELKYGEDTLFSNLIILKRRRYGVLTNAIYYYRRRYDDSSAMQTQATKPHWYHVPPRMVYDGLAQESLRLYNQVLPFVQYIIFYDLGYRLKAPIYEGLPEEEKTAYIALLSMQLKKYVSDFVILDHSGHSVEFKLLALKLKYGDLKPYLTIVNQTIFFNNFKVVTLTKSKWMLRITTLEIRGNNLFLGGTLRKCIWDLLGGEGTLSFHTAGVKGHKAKISHLHTALYNTLYGTEERYVSFEVKIPLDGKADRSYKAMLSFGNLYRCRLKLNFIMHSPLQSNLEHSFCRFGKYLLTQNGSSLKVAIPTNMRQAMRDHTEKLEQEIQAAGAEHIVSIRHKALWLKRWLRLAKKELWLISDRAEIAGDNGEAFFKYLQYHAPKNVLPVFVINANSTDYQRMKQYGKVIDRDSDLNLICTLAANKVISSNGSLYTYNPFGDEVVYVQDLLRRNYVFLQHGIILNDLSSWLSKYSKNIRLFVTTTPREKESIASPLYGYTDEVKLVGLARYDTLLEKAKAITKKKQLLILPTWRKNVLNLPLENPDDTDNLAASYRLMFKETEFFHFYNSLINHPRLLEAMKSHGYTGLFALHPSIAPQWKDFVGNDVIRVQEGHLVYSDAFAESSIMLTDYSSTSFDFIYLRRPLVYCQFDENSFFEDHTVKRGYFDYREDGFGPVCTDLESTVDELIKLMENGASLDPIYQERISQFFVFDDADNCKRTLEAILKLK